MYQGEEQREEKGERGGGESGGGREEERETKRGRGRERWEGGKEEKRSRDIHVQTHHFLFEGDRTVCRLANSSCTTIGGIEEKIS